MKRKIDTFWYWLLVIVSFVVCYMFTCATRTKAVNSNYFYEKGNSYGLINSGLYVYNFKGTTYYFNYNLENYTFNPEDGKWTYINIANSTNVSGDYMWDDGENLYYSSGTSQKVLNFNTMTWENKTWNGLTNFAGNKIWTDGIDIYYSNGTSGHWVLNRNTDTWETKTWTTYIGFHGNYIWKDARGRIFSLSGGNFYKLNDARDEFVRITTSTGLTSGNASYIWTDGINVYHSNASTHYIFDHDNLKWTTKGFLGNHYFSGNSIWHDNVGGVYSTTTFITLKFDYTPSTGSSGYTEEDLENARSEGYEEGFEAGKNSVDITTDNDAYANAVVNELMIQFDMLMQSLENEWNATLEYINEKVGFITEEDIFNIWDMTEGGLVEDPSYKTEYYLTKLEQRWNIWVEEVKATVDITSNDAEAIQNYITNNNYHSNDDYLNYGNQKYQEGQESVDITVDNEAYAEQVIQDKLDKNQLFDAEYVFNVIQNAEDKFYADGYKDGQESVDITSNDAEVIQNYITNNNYHTHSDYLSYGETKYTEGVASVDTEQLINNYITSNNMKTEEQYINYGLEQRREGYFSSYDNFINAYDQVYSSNNYMTGIGYMCETYTSGAYSCSEAYKGYLNNLNNAAINSVDITVNDEQIYNNGLIEGQKLGYKNANEDGEVLGSFIPNLLGGFGSFFLTIMNIDVLGFSLLSLFGIAISIGIIILILKFMRG